MLKYSDENQKQDVRHTCAQFGSIINRLLPGAPARAALHPDHLSASSSLAVALYLASSFTTGICTNVSTLPV